jgi:hypothetical protein
MHNFTPEDLLEYYYGEMPSEKAIILENLLKEDWVLREKLSVIEEAALRLDKSIYSPSEKTISSILSYASKKGSVSMATKM